MKLSIDELYYLLKHIKKLYLIDCRPLIEFNKSRIVDRHYDCNKYAIKTYEEDHLYKQFPEVVVLLTDGEIPKYFLMYLKKYKINGYYCNEYSLFAKKYKTIINNKIYFVNVNITEIIPKFLYLGNQMNSENLELLKSLKITHILNCTNNIKNLFPNDFKYHRIPIYDDYDQQIDKYFEESIKFINNCRKNNGRILIHCYAGISRSATITIAYIMKMNKYKFIDTYKYVKKQRSIVEPNLDFKKSLKKWEIILGN
jgi:protein-tyrosine phosphatase